jgi:hypothetical protein
MRALLVLLVAVCVVAGIVLASDGPIVLTPVIRTVSPAVAKCGDELVASGENLSAAAVESLYLTVGEATAQVVIVEQKEKSIKFKVPETVKPGRLGLMVLTAGPVPHYIDEPVYITVEQ